MNSFYTSQELEQIGFASIGKNVLISRKASIYSASSISLGSNVRIDDFSILSGKIIIGSNVHISAYVALYGSMGIFLQDFSGISARTTIYSAVDDFSGEYMVGPMSPNTHVSGGPVIMEKYTQIGASCVVMPNIIIREGSVVGSMSFVNKTLDPWGVYVGIPVYKLKDRSKRLLDLNI
ncbi:DapH/DapD/GlmU-related protein [Parabacteroides gordonii]|jgi:acetyltransferase-like isoleucine patch superfamily enzyme|uniref:acyltransferase n=1 Tax=Parabacteroides gordonii TaxID=574930 RepID=UPI00241F9585|nr:DapH/DapD/GlmU-related protein [Parabacteroides gordonii]